MVANEMKRRVMYLAECVSVGSLRVIYKYDYMVLALQREKRQKVDGSVMTAVVVV